MIKSTVTWIGFVLFFSKKNIDVSSHLTWIVLGSGR